MARKLTEKMNKFALLYVKTGCLWKAYRGAYNTKMDKPGCSKRGGELKKHPLVAAKIRYYRKLATQQLILSENAVLGEYARIAFADPRELFNKKGKLKPIHKLNEDIVSAISGIEQTLDPKTGLPVYKVKFWPKVPALEALAKNLGLFERDNKQKIDATASDEELAAELKKLRKLVG